MAKQRFVEVYGDPRVVQRIVAAVLERINRGQRIDDDEFLDGLAKDLDDTFKFRNVFLELADRGVFRISLEGAVFLAYALLGGTHPAAAATARRTSTNSPPPT